MRTDQPTRIAFCITELDPGGAEWAFVRLVTGLDRSRWSPAVFCLAGPGPLVSPLEAAGVPVTCFGARGIRDLRVTFQLARELRKLQPALLQTFLFHANLIGRIAGWRAGVQLIVSGIRVAEKRTRTHLWLDRLTNPLVTKNVCVSQAVADFSIQRGGLKPSKVVIIPNGVDTGRFADAKPADITKLGFAPETTLFIFVGRLDRQKGLPYLLKAMQHVVTQQPLARLLLVGAGDERNSIESWIQEHGLAEIIKLTGWSPDVPELLQVADCLVLPSLWEGMPNVILEAMAAGKPVIATQVEGTAELIREGWNGFLVPVASATGLAEAMKRMLTAPETAQMLGRNGQSLARQHFSWAGMVAKYEALYRELLKRSTKFD